MIDLGKRDIIGVNIDSVDYEAAVERVLRAAETGKKYTVTALAVHGVMTGVLDPAHRDRINTLDMVTPDGQPVRWALNLLHGAGLHDRVYGPTLMLRICSRCAQTGIPVYLYGSNPDTIQKLDKSISAMFPHLKIAGYEPSVFRPMSDAEMKNLADRIARSGARVAFVGLGCPLQERFIHELRAHFNGVLVAVGAAFDFHAGTKPQAPDWMKDRGFEWLFRLANEPARLWKRYLLLNPLYVCLVGRQFLQILARKLPPHRHPAPLPTAMQQAPPDSAPSATTAPQHFLLSNVRVHAVNVSTAVSTIRRAVTARRKGYVCVTGAHGVVEAETNPELRTVINAALLNVPDGMPLVWLGRAAGYNSVDRVYGPDLMLAVCARSAQAGWRHFLYGGKEGVANELRDRLISRFPGINIVGAYCPPFRPLNQEETTNLIRTFDSLQPDITWVGLSTPKQELFMAGFLPRLSTTVMIGVGAAFDLHTGRMRDAPDFVKRIGMQWLHRLLQEPRRLGPRYCRIVPRFIAIAARSMSGGSAKNNLAKRNRP